MEQELLSYTFVITKLRYCECGKFRMLPVRWLQLVICESVSLQHLQLIVAFLGNYLAQVVSIVSRHKLRLYSSRHPLDAIMQNVLGELEGFEHVRAHVCANQSINELVCHGYGVATTIIMVKRLCPPRSTIVGSWGQLSCSSILYPFESNYIGWLKSTNRG